MYLISALIITILAATSIALRCEALGVPDVAGSSAIRFVGRRLRCATLLVMGAAALWISSVPAMTQADSVPPGPYLQHAQPLHFGEGCFPVSMQGSTLVATCANLPLGRLSQSTLADANACVAKGHEIDNINGVLRCVIFRGVAAGGEDGDSSHQYVGNIVSMLPDVTTPAGTTRHFIIDNPRVDVESSDFKMITYQPGDSITLWAGGCAQTGGIGDTWKYYPTPLGHNAGLYMGTVGLPGITTENAYGLGFERIDHYISNDRYSPHARSYPVPIKLPQSVLNEGLFLRLGYVDDNHSDNGYWKHDDGNPKQCVGIGPAWVMIAILHPPPWEHRSSGASWWPAFKPFDLTWKTNVPADANGFPLNPVWDIQVTSPSPGASPSPQAPCGWSACGAPDFAGICGKAFDPGGHIYVNTLSDVCTTNDPIIDVDTSPFRGASFPGIAGGAGYCTDHGPFPGHLNWSYGTYEGVLKWDSYNGPPGGDYDYSMHLIRNDQALSTHGGLPGVYIEANSTTSFALLGTNWWQTFYSHNSDSEKHALIDGLFAVVTGQVGIDGVHYPGQVEIHPMFAMAVRTAVKSQSNSVIETWDYFIVNEGDEGSCSEYMYFWGPSGTVQIPWPPDAVNAQILTRSGEKWADQNGGIQFQDPSYQNSRPWTLINFQMPRSSKIAGADGEVVIEFTVSGAKPEKHSPIRPGSTTGRFVESPDDTLPRLAASIRDPQTQLKFSADLRNIMIQTPPVVRRMRLAASKMLMAEENTVFNLTRRAALARPRRFVNTIRARQEEQIRALLRKYRRSFPRNFEIPSQHS